MAMLALPLMPPVRRIIRWRMASCPASEWQRVKAALHKAQRKVREPALVIWPGWVRPADSFTSAVSPAQNSRASALGKRSKGPISAAMMQLQISPMPGTRLQELRDGAEALASGWPSMMA